MLLRPSTKANQQTDTPSIMRFQMTTPVAIITLSTTTTKTGSISSQKSTMP